MCSRRQRLRLNRIVVEATPLLKRRTRKVIVLRRIPHQEVRGIREADTTAEGLDHGSRGIEHVVRVNDADLMLRLPRAGLLRLQVRPGRHARSHEPLVPEVVEVPPQLVVPGLQRVIVVEPRHVVERRDRAPVVRRHAVVRVADQERPVEALLQLPLHHRWVARLCRRVVRVRLLAGPVRVPVHGRAIAVGVPVGLGVVAVDPVGSPIGSAVGRRAIGAVGVVGGTVGWHGGVAVGVSGAVAGPVHAIGRVFVVGARGAHATLDASQRRSNTRGLAVRRKQVVVDILDEDSLALQSR